MAIGKNPRNIFCIKKEKSLDINKHELFKSYWIRGQLINKK